MVVLFTHGITYKMYVLGTSLDWIDSTFSSFIQNTSSHILHCKILGDSKFLTTTWFLYSLTLVLIPQVVPLGRLTLDLFKRPMRPLRLLREASPPQMPFFTKIRKVAIYSKQFCIAKAIESRLEEATLRKSLEFWRTLFQSDPQNEASKVAIGDLWFQLQILMDRKEDGCRIQSKTNQMKSGDRMDKYSFSSIKEHLAGGLITK